MTSSHRGRLRALAAGGVLALAAGAFSAAPSTAAPQPLAPASALARPAAAPAPESASDAAPRRDGGHPTVVMPGRATPLARVAAAAPPRHDVDGDGLSDMITMEYDQSTGVYLSSISAWSDYAIYKTDPEASFKDLLPVGDVGGTTKPELLSLSFDGVLTLYEAGLTSTSAPLWSGGGWQKYNRLIATGDITGDRHPDLLARDHAGDLWLYTGTGTVSKPFNTRAKVGSGWGIYDQLVGASDVDGDGIGDVLTRTLTGELWFHKGSGSATAPLKARVKVGTGWNTYNVISGPDDVDGDGMSDLLARNRDGLQYYYKSIGGGRFAAPAYFGSGYERNKFIVGAGTTQLYGKGQNLMTQTNNTLAKYYALANGAYLSPPTNAGTETPGSRNTYATALNSHNHASYVQNIGSDLYIRGQKVSTTWNYNLMVGPGDLTGDGKGDLLSRDSAGVLWLHPGDGAVYTKLGARIKVGTGWNAYNALVGAGDYSGDGRPDVLARDTSGRLFLYKGTGTSTAPFAAREQVATGWNVYDMLVVPGDIDGDSKGDVLARLPNGDMYLYTSTGNAGTATFTARVKFGTGWNIYKNMI
ncbi:MULTISPECIES: VCBS repeat-containing protein [unclassified Streptomyces]|uniref:FG-GAP repeat domain-containing protein n=1 Tax=unclassified Streptomyces TaxID=2593676 RepID=UPI001BED2C58|nr:MULTISPECIES: VCBS repeat-containing protein [unclassified Streptomyces]MBT2408721.1 VCBS repeat-containing protein [Streptomyces sp. ISL-21]MBT2612039.1 VCBS repeat-containing protein [Streptomyces sp. ISL-87]